MDNYNYNENDDTIKQEAGAQSPSYEQPYQQGQPYMPPQQNMPYQQGQPYMPPQQNMPYQQGQPYMPPQQNMPYQQGQPYMPPQQNMPYQQGQPYMQYYPVVKKRTDTFAIISLIFGLLSIVTVSTVWFSIIFSIVAIVCAIVSRVNAGKFEGPALAGFIIGIIFLIISLLIFFMALALLQNPEFLERLNEMMEEYQNNGSYKYFKDDNTIKILSNMLFK